MSADRPTREQVFAVPPPPSRAGEASRFWASAFAMFAVGGIGAAIVLSQARHIDGLERWLPQPAATLPGRCDAPAAQGDRLVVTLTLRGQVIHVTCRPIKAVRS